jgi:hypothetical protein
MIGVLTDEHFQLFTISSKIFFNPLIGKKNPHNLKKKEKGEKKERNSRSSFVK